MIIDFEAHAQMREVTQAYGDKAADTMQAIYDFGDVRLGMMDSAGVSMQVISYPGPLQLLSPDDAAYYTAMENDNSCRVANHRPDRFRGYAMLPVNNVEFALNELVRAKNKLGLVGWFTVSSFGNRAIDDDESLPLVYKAAELGMHIYLHPAMPSWERFKGCGPMVENAFGFHVDPALTLLRLIAKGVFDRCPELKIILGHYGEGLPFMLDRMDSFRAPPDEKGEAKNKQPLGYYFEKNVWVTTSGSFSKVAFNCTKDRLGADHILFGSDFPVEDLGQTVDFLDSMSMTRLEREKICYRNAGDYFGIWL